MCARVGYLGHQDDFIFDSHQIRRELCLGLAGELPHEKGQEHCSHPLFPERDDLSLNSTDTKEDCKVQFISSVSNRNFPSVSSLQPLHGCLGHEQVLGTLCLYRDLVFGLLPKSALELCFSTCHVLQHQASLGNPP